MQDDVPGVAAPADRQGRRRDGPRAGADRHRAAGAQGRAAAAARSCSSSATRTRPALEQQPGVTVHQRRQHRRGRHGQPGREHEPQPRALRLHARAVLPAAGGRPRVDRPRHGQLRSAPRDPGARNDSIGSALVDAELLELDRTRVWHPYGPMPAAAPPLPVVSAQGVRLTLADGRELVDGMASLVVRDPRLPAPGDRRGDQRSARPDGARDVRRAHARAGDPPRGAPDGLDRARPRVLRGLRQRLASRSRSSSSCSTGTASGGSC